MSTTLKAHFTWRGMDSDILKYVRACPVCQKCKKTAVRPVGHLPLRSQRSVVPFERVHVDLVGPWNITTEILGTPNRVKKIKLVALTMICEASLWPDIAKLENATAWHVAKKFDSTWLCRYPRPSTVIFDNGGEFCGDEFQELLESYSIKAQPTTVKNPQANGVVERMHLTMGDMLRTMTVTVAKDDPIRTQDEIQTMLNAVAWGLRTTASTITQVTPGQTIYGRDMIFNFKMRANWGMIQKRRQQLAIKNNNRENSKRKPFEYKPGMKVLIVHKRYERIQKIADNPAVGPYEIIKVNQNGTVVLQREGFKETVSIRRIKPFYEEETGEIN